MSFRAADHASIVRTSLAMSGSRIVRQITNADRGADRGQGGRQVVRAATVDVTGLDLILPTLGHEFEVDAIEGAAYRRAPHANDSSLRNRPALQDLPLPLHASRHAHAGGDHGDWFSR